MTSSQIPTPSPFLDAKPFEHSSSQGVKFEIARCDLNGTLNITAPKDMPEELIMLQLCEMMTWHCYNINHLLLNGHSCYVKKVVINKV